MAEHEYNNPVVLAFVECILDSANITISSSSMDIKTNNHLCKSHKKKINLTRGDLERTDSSLMIKEKTAGINDDMASKRARTRWFLAYTLVHNPVVIKITIIIDQRTHFSLFI